LVKAIEYARASPHGKARVVELTYKPENVIAKSYTHHSSLLKLEISTLQVKYTLSIFFSPLNGGYGNWNLADQRKSILQRMALKLAVIGSAVNLIVNKVKVIPLTEKQ